MHACMIIVSFHCQLSLQKPKPSKKVIHYRKIKAIDPAKFTSDISESRLCSSNGSLAADELVHQYNEFMGELLDEHAPQRSCFCCRASCSSVVQSGHCKCLAKTALS